MQNPRASISDMLLTIFLQRLKQLDEMDRKLDKLNKIDRIERKLIDKGTPRFLVKDAIKGFKNHITAGVSKRGSAFRQPRNYDYLLRVLGRDFGQKNLSDLTPEQIDGWLRKYWEHPGTLKQRIRQLSAFFSWCILLLKKRRQPAFTNPCILLDPIKQKVKVPKFVTTDAMRDLIESAVNERQWLTFAIMATAGLRISEVLKLRKAECNGRVLTLIEPKSGNEEEIAVVPAKVARRLAEYAKGFDLEDRLFALQSTAVYKSLVARGQTSHKLRKWCITYWARKGDQSMELFVRRHSRTTLRDRYVAPLTAEEAMKKQNVMERELWKK